MVSEPISPEELDRLESLQDIPLKELLDHDCNQALRAEYIVSAYKIIPRFLAMKGEEMETNSKTVKVRIAVAVNEDGTWAAFGTSERNDADKYAIASVHAHCYGKRHHVQFVEAELLAPIPENQVTRGVAVDDDDCNDHCAICGVPYRAVRPGNTQPMCDCHLRVQESPDAH